MKKRVIGRNATVIIIVNIDNTKDGGEASHFFIN